MVSCAVKSCKIYSGKKGVKERNITHHKFPDHLLLKEKWTAACRRPNWKPTHQSKICSRHFTADSFKVSKKGWRRLHEDAVPTLFLRSPDDDDFEEPVSKRKRSEAGAGSATSDRHGEKESKSGEIRVRTGPASTGCTYPESNTFTLDQEVLADMHELSDKIQNVYPTVQGKSFTVAFKGVDGDKSEYVFSSASQSRRAGAVHSGLSCNECHSNITGFRYKCVSCPDYDLCGACEALGVHSQHMVMRISRPLKFRHARTLIQRWCDAMNSAGISSPDALMCDPPASPPPRAHPPCADTMAATDRHDDSEPDDPDVNFVVITSHQPLTTKPEPFDEAKLSKSSKSTAKSSKVDKKKTKEGATKQTIVTESNKEREMKSETAGDREQSLVNYYGTFGETEPALAADDVKIEEDPLSSEMSTERHLKSIEDNLSRMFSTPSDSRQNGARRDRQAGTAPPQETFRASQPGLAVQSDLVLGESGISSGSKWDSCVSKWT